LDKNGGQVHVSKPMTFIAPQSLSTKHQSMVAQSRTVAKVKLW